MFCIVKFIGKIFQDLFNKSSIVIFAYILSYVIFYALKRNFHYFGIIEGYPILSSVTNLNTANQFLDQYRFVYYINPLFKCFITFKFLKYFR